MPIFKLGTILNNDTTAIHINRCTFKCREDKEIQEHMFNFFMFTMHPVNPGRETLSEREEKIRIIQRKIQNRIIEIHEAAFLREGDDENIGYIPRSGVASYDIGKLDEARDVRATYPVEKVPDSDYLTRDYFTGEPINNAFTN